MLIKDIPFFVKFIFSGDTGDCYSTTDIEIFEFIKYKSTNKAIYGIEVGDKIYFEPNPQSKFYEVTNVKIRHLTKDTETQKYGIDSEDCTGASGKEKEYFFSILVNMKLLG